MKMGRAGCARGWLIPGAEGLEQSRVTCGVGGREKGQQESSGIAAGPQAQLPAGFQPLSGVVGHGQVLSSGHCVGWATQSCTEPLSCPAGGPCQDSPPELGRHSVMHQNNSVAHPAAGPLLQGSHSLPGSGKSKVFPSSPSVQLSTS